MCKNIAGTCRETEGNQKFKKRAKHGYYDVIMDRHQVANLCKGALTCYKYTYEV